MYEEELHDGPPTPTNFSYGYAKRSLAVQIDAYNKQYGTNYQYLIPCNLYGEFDKYGKEEADKRQKESNEKNKNSNTGKRLGLKNPLIAERNKKRTKPVLQYDLNDNFIKEWNSSKDASLFLKIGEKTIRNSCLGIQGKNAIFKWKYKNPSDLLSNKNKKK